MSFRDKVRFFTELADRWDAKQDLHVLAASLSAGLFELGVGTSETVLDVGCGTGNLTRALLDHLGRDGRVLGLDVAPAMIEAARRKNHDHRVAWLIADARHLPLPTASVDRVVCFSAWPHFDDAAASARELCRVLRHGGRLHVWHLVPRESVNAIHAAAAAVRHDLLGPAHETAELLHAVGMSPEEVIDDNHRYLVTALKRSA
jgi:demethylmenaquinone methyltransferase/2-methoxy-6-polyprenyl-1,4-benzoquinol methylase